MDQKYRTILATALGDLRNLRRIASPSLPLRAAHVAGLIEGLEDASALTATEAREWNRRTDEVIAEPPDSTQSSSSGSPTGTITTFNDSVSRPGDTSSARLVAGPFEASVFDGLLRVVALEILDDRFYLHWRITPLPTLDAILGRRDLAAFKRDLEGIDWDAQIAEMKSAVYSALHSTDFILSDEIGTKFRRRSGGGGGNGYEEWGVAIYVPAPPSDATRLNLVFHDAHIGIPLG